jgi:hypothetical protein
LTYISISFRHRRILSEIPNTFWRGILINENAKPRLNSNKYSHGTFL